jgi:hypothetical protein
MNQKIKQMLFTMVGVLIVISTVNATSLESKGDEFLGALAVMSHGTELGIAEGCGYPKTAEYLSRFQNEITRMKISDSSKAKIMAEFQRYRKDAKQSVEIGEEPFKSMHCNENKASYLESTIWQPDWHIGVQ